MPNRSQSCGSCRKLSHPHDCGQIAKQSWERHDGPNPTTVTRIATPTSSSTPVNGFRVQKRRRSRDSPAQKRASAHLVPQPLDQITTQNFVLSKSFPLRCLVDLAAWQNCRYGSIVGPLHSGSSFLLWGKLFTALPKQPWQRLSYSTPGWLYIYKGA